MQWGPAVAPMPTCACAQRLLAVWHVSALSHAGHKLHFVARAPTACGGVTRYRQSVCSSAEMLNLELWPLITGCCIHVVPIHSAPCAPARTHSSRECLVHSARITHPKQGCSQTHDSRGTLLRMLLLLARSGV